MTGAPAGRKAAGLGVAVLLAVAVGACGATSHPSQAHGARTAGVPGTASLQGSTCADWRTASRRERLATIRLLTLAATKPDPENRGATLDARDASSLFQRACSTRQSRWAVLYEIYNRAAAFRRARGGSPAP